MNMTDKSRTTNPVFTKKFTSLNLSPFRLRHVAAIAVALMFLGAGRCVAQDEPDFVWIVGNGTWNTGSSWATNLYDYYNTNTMAETCRATSLPNDVNTNLNACGFGGSGSFPQDAYQRALFTNAATYTVTMSGSVSTGSNVFQNASNTAAIVTLDLNGKTLEPQDSWAVATKRGSTTTVYIVDSGPLHNGTLKVHGNPTIGVNGFGTVYFNAGTIDNGGGSVNLGTGDDGRGILWVSGSSAWLQPNSQISVGNDPQGDPQGSMLVVSNGAHAFCSSSFRVGSGSGKGGTSNNLVVVDGATLTCDSGPEVIGLRSTGVTNSDGGTLCFNNVLLVKGGGLWACAFTSTKSVCIGDAAWFGLSQTTTATPPAICTGNVLRIMSDGVVTGASTMYVAPSNNVELLGGRLEAVTISNWGNMIAYGIHGGEERVFAGAMLKTRNSLGKLTISNGLWMVTNSVLEVELGTNYNATEIDFGDYTKQGHLRGGTNRFTVDQATLNILDSGGLTNRTSYDLFNYATNMPPGGWGAWAGDATNALGITNFTGFVLGKRDTSPRIGYTVDTNLFGKVRLLVKGAIFRITSVARQANNDVVITWTGPLGVTNRVQATAGSGNGNYSTNTFADITSDIIVATQSVGNALWSDPSVSTYTDPKGATNQPARYYRIRQVGQ